MWSSTLAQAYIVSSMITFHKPGQTPHEPQLISSSHPHQPSWSSKSKHKASWESLNQLSLQFLGTILPRSYWVVLGKCLAEHVISLQGKMTGHKDQQSD